MAVKPVVYDDSNKKHRPLGSGEKMDGLSASSIISSQSGNLITTGSDGLAYATGSGIIDPAADNLLEATSGGKIKMDVDRLAEWLDGHPQDAKDIADALNIVSGDSGNLIHEGSDGGAYMSSAQLAAALAALTDAQRQALAAELADGTTITASGGKLHAVHQGGDADALVDGQTTVAQNGKIKVNYGAGLKFDPQSGKLVVVFNDLTAEQIFALCDPTGGIATQSLQWLAQNAKWYDHAGVEHTVGQGSLTHKAVVGDVYLASDGKTKTVTATDVANNLYLAENPNYGLLAVDFSRMDDTAFRVLMSDMIDKQTIKTEGGGNQFYVDGGIAGSDNNPAERGDPANPFKTIQACVNYITKVYKFADINAYINCKGVDVELSKPLTLPSFDRTTSEITIRGASFNANTPRNSPTTVTGKTIKLSYAPAAYIYQRYTINVTGTGVWRLRNVEASITDADLVDDGGHLAALHVMNYATCYISDCRFINNRATTDASETAKLAKYDYTTGEHVVMLTDYGLLEIGAYNELVCHDVLDATATVKRKINGFAATGSSTLHVGDTRSDKAYTVLEFTLDGAAASDTVIPAGTQASVGTASGALVFATDFALTIPAGSTKGKVSASCTTSGTSGNGVPVGGVDTLVGTVSGVAIDSVTNTVKSNYAAADDRRIKMTGSFAKLLYVSAGHLSRNAAYQGQVDVSGVTRADHKMYIFSGGYVWVSDYGLLDESHNGANSTDTWLGVNGTNGDGSSRTSYVESSTFSWYK